MLIATSEWRSETAEVHTTLVLGETVRAQLVKRHGLLFDTRFMVGAPRARGVATVYLLLEGLSVAADRAVERAPCAWIFAEEEFETSDPRAPRVTVRSWGEPLIAVDLCVAARDVRLPIGVSHGPYRLSDRTWQAVGALARAGGDPQIAAAFQRMIEHLVADQLLARVPAEDWAAGEPAHLGRVWGAVTALYRKQDTSAYLDALAALSNTSLRQLEREVAEVSRRFGLHGGFRSSARLMRLRRAVLLLSARGVTVAEVAAAVGYGSIDAMGRAFRDAGLPSPSAVRDAVIVDP